MSFQVVFDLKAFEDLDQLALLARQDYNLGDAGKWFGEFRGGLYGFYARLYGVSFNYEYVHAWLPRPRLPTETEYHLAATFFGMDSALECFTFALNAFGYAAYPPPDFRDITDARALAKINPRDIIKGLVPGYAKAFPRVQQHWQAEKNLIETIFEVHDVSKHRQTIYRGGQGRLDPPAGFYDGVDLSDDRASTVLSPMAEILLEPEPKLPAVSRKSRPREEYELLEKDLVPQFAGFIHKTGELALHDARSTVPLNEREFRTA